MAMKGSQQHFSQFLRLAFLRSPNYAAGSSGWTINQDGSAEFNNLTVRGTFDGNEFEVNKDGAFFYSPAKGSGNLVASITVAAGTDRYGNTYFAGINSYGSGGLRGGVNQAAFNLANGSSSWSGGLHVDANDSNLVNLFAELAGGGTAALLLDPSTSQIFAGYGSVFAAAEPGTNVTPETWHALTLASGWANSGGGGEQNAAYRVNALGDLQLTGVITGSAVTGSNTLATLPSGYFDTGGNLQAACAVISAAGLSTTSSPYLQVGTGGALTLHGIGTAGTVKISLSAYFPLSSGSA